MRNFEGSPEGTTNTRIGGGGGVGVAEKKPDLEKQKLNQAVATAEIFGRNKPEVKEPLEIDPLHNDNLLPTFIPTVLKKVEVVDGRGEVKNHDEEINSLFLRLAATRSVEADFPRTQYLQGLLDRMTEGTDTQTKVYILSRGQDANAFAVADGSIL